MATLRERHPACHGVGHANRPRQHHAVGLDSQPRSLCLSAGWSRYANTNANRKSYSDGNSDAYSNSFIDTEADAYTSNSADTQTSSNTSTSPADADSR